jgi:hypothetical protein
VGGDVLLRQNRVALLGEHIASRPYEQRSERHVPSAARGGRQLDGSAQVTLVHFGHPSSPLLVLT